MFSHEFSQMFSHECRNVDYFCLVFTIYYLPYFTLSVESRYAPLY